ncbi:MAG: hypothetical protein ABII26_01335 [Pseudomonadota bacterium]
MEKGYTLLEGMAKNREILHENRKVMEGLPFATPVVADLCFKKRSGRTGTLRRPAREERD